MTDEFIQPLFGWYDENKRILPWRDQHNAYYTWVSEIMLQQTRVEAVRPWLLQPRPQHAAGSPGDGRKI